MATFFYKTGNTRVIKQSSLQKFQEEMDAVMKDPYKVVMKQSKLPMSLLHDRIRPHVRWRCPWQWDVFSKCLADPIILVSRFPTEDSGFDVVLMSFARLFSPPLLGGLTCSMNRILSVKFGHMLTEPAWGQDLDFNLCPTPFCGLRSIPLSFHFPSCGVKIAHLLT